MKDDFEQICKVFRAFCLAVPFQDHPMRPQALFMGNVVILEPGKFTEVTKENYEKIVGQLCDKMIGLARVSEDPVVNLFIYLTDVYYVQYLYFIKDLLSQKTFSECLSFCWTTPEFPNQHDTSMLIDLFRKADKQFLMDDVELLALNDLPSVIKIYRGLQTPKAKKRGLSWTLSLDRARWFANRWKKNCDVLSAEVTKEHVLAVFLGRNEQEVVVNPRGLRNICKVSQFENIMK